VIGPLIDERAVEKAETHGKKENYIRMLRGGLRNIESDFERRKIDLDQSRHCVGSAEMGQTGLLDKLEDGDKICE
jgi:hypothetical protein